ncbi:MAG: acyl-CoA synthetase [Gammaproteobacteria bacterium]
MTALTEITGYQESLAAYSKDKLWALFDGDRSILNIAHECIDRHPSGQVAVNIIDGDSAANDESLSFGDLKIWSNRFANYLHQQNVQAGERVAIMLEPSLIFYAALFGAMKANCVAVPLFTLFGPDGVRLRLQDCDPKLFIAAAEHIDAAAGGDHFSVTANDSFMDELAACGNEYRPDSSADDMAMYQYTSGTTRQLPDAIKHRHRAIVTVMLAALYGTGVRPGDKFCCPSSPAWGHGLWHGTLAPLALGATITSYRGKFDPHKLIAALDKYQITNLSAAATHYRMMRNAADTNAVKHHIEKLSFTGEPIDSDTEAWVGKIFGHQVCSMYGTTEVGVVLVSYPTAEDFATKPGSLGKAVPGLEVAVVDAAGNQCAPHQKGEIVVKRRDSWFPTKDLGYTDEDGYFYHAGRADDVIISAGWTMSAVEIENVLLQHADIKEVAVVASPDQARGQIPKAFVVSERRGDDSFKHEIITLAKERLSQHEYPRAIAFVEALPKLPAGKINRKHLRESEKSSFSAQKSREQT